MSRRSSLPSALLSVHGVAGGGWLWLLRALWYVGVDVSEVEGEVAAQPLHFAAANGQLGVLRFLVLTCRLSPSVCTSDGWQALHFAAAGGYQPTVAWLLEEVEGQSAEAQTQPSGHRPLHCAAMRGQLSVVRYLTAQHRVDVQARTADGHSALHFAAAAGATSVVRFLAGHAPPSLIDAADAQGRTALHHAARRGHVDALTALLALDVSLRTVDSLGFDAASLAALQGRADCVRLCVEERERRRQPMVEGEWGRLLQLVDEALQAEERWSSASDRDGDGDSDRLQRLKETHRQLQMRLQLHTPNQPANPRPALTDQQQKEGSKEETVDVV